MREPVITIDLGHSSSPDATPTPWEETRRALQAAEVFWFSTVRADGRPHVTPVSALWLEGVLYVQTSPAAQKSRNLRENTHVALTTGRNQFEPGFDVVVEGSASECTDVAVFERLNQMWRAVWGEGWPIEYRDGVFYESGGTRPGAPLVVFAVTPSRIFAYVRGDQWSQTNYQF